jgi:hypothetical protein
VNQGRDRLKSTGPRAPNCVTVTLQGDNAVNLFAAAYLSNRQPANILANYLADPRVAPRHTRSHSTSPPEPRVPIDVHDVPPSLIRRLHAMARRSHGQEHTESRRDASSVTRREQRRHKTT